MNKNIFENYLMEIHAKDYIGTDDDMPDDYENWLDNVDKNELIEFASKALSQQRQEIIEMIEKERKMQAYNTMAGNIRDEDAVGYNQALEEILNQLKK